MSEFHEGRVAATFQLGARLENTKEAYEKEIIGIDGAKAAVIGVMRALDEYRKAVQQEGIDGKIPIKEADTAIKYLSGCLEITQKLLGEAEAKRFAAVGAIEALKKVVADAKRLWDEETQKLKQIQEFEAQSPKDLKDRPVGYMPTEHPLAEHKQETVEAPEKLTKTPPKARKTPKTPGTQV